MSEEKKATVAQKSWTRFKASNQKLKTSFKEAKTSKSYEDIAGFLLSFAGVAITYWMVTTIAIIVLYMFEANIFSNDFMLQLYVNLSITIPFGTLLGVSVKVAGQRKSRISGFAGAIATLACFIMISINIWSGFDWGPELWQKSLMIFGSGAFIFSMANGFMLADYWRKYEKSGKLLLQVTAFLSTIIAAVIIYIADLRDYDNDRYIYNLARCLGIFVSILLGSGLLGVTSILIRKEGSEQITWRKNTAILAAAVIIGAVSMSILTLTLEWYDWMNYIFTERILGTVAVCVVAGIGIGVALPNARQKQKTTQTVGITAIITTLICAAYMLSEIYDWWHWWEHGELLFHSWLIAFHAIFLCMVGLIPVVASQKQAGRINLCWYSSMVSVLLWESLVEFEIIEFSVVTVGILGITKVLMVFGAITAFLIYREDALKRKKELKRMEKRQAPQEDNKTQA